VSAQSSKRVAIGGWLISILGVSLAVMALTLNRTAVDVARNDMALKLVDAVSVLGEQLKDKAFVQAFRRESELAKCHALAMLLASCGKESSDGEIDGIVRKLAISGYAISDERGIVVHASRRCDIGYNLASQEQSRPFLKAATDPNFELVQEVRPRGRDGERCQYVGVARLDRPGCVQIDRTLDAYERDMSVASLTRRARTLRIGEGGSVLMAQNGRVIASPVADAEGRLLADLGLDLADVEAGDFVRRHVDGTDSLICYERLEDVLLVGILPMSEVRTVPRACVNAFLIAALAGLILLVAIPSKCL